jgi:phosphoserine aminotransferase
MSSEEIANERETSAEMPELSEEGKEKVRQMQEAYNDDRQTAVLPGTNNTITGVAVNEWLDDEGNPKFGKDKQQQDQNDTKNA